MCRTRWGLGKGGRGANGRARSGGGDGLGSGSGSGTTGTTGDGNDGCGAGNRAVAGVRRCWQAMSAIPVKGHACRRWDASDGAQLEGERVDGGRVDLVCTAGSAIGERRYDVASTRSPAGKQVVGINHDHADPGKC